MSCRRRLLGIFCVPCVIARFIEGYVEYERIAQHISNIRAINFGSNPVPEGINNYLREQIAFIRKMVCTCP